ncbi:MAG: hypothetical protein ABSB35_05065 [Bryobacteraceae bacterium]|jgi:hypothetical protein
MNSSDRRADAREKQQTIERRYFEMFRKVYPLPSGTVTHGDKPGVILNGAKRIGIEIRNFYVTEGTLPNSEQVQRRFREAAVAKAQRVYQCSAGKNIRLAFGFDKRNPIQNANRLAKQLAALARRVEGADNGPISRSIFQDIPQLEFVHLNARELQYSAEPDPKYPDGRPDPEKGCREFAEYWSGREARALREGIYKPFQSPEKWTVCQGHDFGPMSISRLVEIVKEKQAKARSYAACDAYWLLIVVDFIDSAQEQEIRVDGITIESETFEKIIIYKPYFEHIVDITPIPPPADDGPVIEVETFARGSSIRELPPKGVGESGD